MNSNNILIILRYLLLIPLQVLIANHFRLFGYINPQIGLLFILWYPLKKDISGFLIQSFFFGLFIDMCSNSGGVNAAAYVLIAYTRLSLLKFIFKDKDLDLKLFRYSNYGTLPKVALIFCLAIIHQFILYLLEYFSLTHLLSILEKTFFNSIFTTFVIIIFLSIFTATKKQ